MTTSLRERAAAAAATGLADPVGPPPERPTITGDPLPDISYDDNTILDAQLVPVHVAWARVMADVQSISKGDQRNDVGGRYSFRGVDRVVNAVGPALRRHGVLVLPTRILSAEYREARTSKGNVMRECVVTVQWTIRGPGGDDLPPVESIGEATDTQDKATAKAVSVAQRVLFLSSLQIPTQDPDIDRGHERGELPTPKASDYVDEICDGRTSSSRLRQIWKELGTHRLLTVPVINEVGDEEPIGKLVERIGEERKAAAAGGAS